MTLHWRTLRWSAWLGWQIDSNWANPWLFVLYVMVKPLAGAMLLVCMFWAVRAVGHDSVTPGFLPFLYVSSSAFMVVGGVAFGISNAVVTDRDSYGMLKFIRMSPAGFRSYLVGRGLSRTLQASVGAFLTVGIGLVLFPELREALDIHAIAWGWLAFYLVTGTVMMLSLGLLLAGAVLNMARYGMFLSEGIAGLLYLLSGAVFPIEVLPAGLRALSMVLPPTYWLEGMRRALLGLDQLPSPLAEWRHADLAVALLLSTLALAASAHVFFRWSEQRAWRHGRYDQIAGI
jgi:ABC-2 type transport system permease protein